MTKSRGILVRVPWTAEQDALLRERYPDTRTEDLVPLLAHSLCSIYNRAQRFGLQKSEAFKASPASGRTNGRQGIGTRFVKGQTPANKGKKCEEGRGGRHPNAKRTQFAKGKRQGKAGDHWMPIGAERTVAGYRYIKIADELNVPWTRNWKATHIVKWEAINGPLPKGHVLKSLDGNRENTDPSNWTAIPRALLPRLAGGNGRGNRKLSYDNAPAELRPVILAVAKLEHAAREKAGAA